MPRLNEERTHEVKAWMYHRKHLEENYAGRSINEGWSQDGFTISSKVYGDEPMVVTTSLQPPYNTSEEPYG